MGGKISKSIIRFHNIIYYERKKQELVNIAYSKDALTNYIQRHRDDIDELLSWDSHSETALHFVVNEGWMEGVEAIVEAGADVNVFDANKFEILPNVPGREAYVLYTPLMCVVGNHRNLEIAQYLLAHGADPHLRCPNTGWSAVSLAIANCRVDLILLLIEEYDVEPTKVFDMTCEWLFRKYNRSSKLNTIVLIELLLEKGAQMRPHYVHFALNRGWLEVLKVFVKAGADINSFDTGHEFTLDVYTCGIYLQPHSRGFPWNMYTPLMRAARSPDLFDHAQYLLAHGADPHLKCPNTGESAVSVAIKHSNVDLVQLLIQKYNVKCDPTQVLKMIQKYVVEFDPTKALTMTWNMLSHSTNEECQQDTAEFIELLLEKGAQMELHYMHVAVGRGWLKIVEVFVKRGSDVNVFAPPACYRSYKERNWDCTFSVSGSALQRSIRYTPLMIAARSPHLFDIAQYLLGHGADPNLRCPNNGDSAFSLAIVHCNTALIDLLIQWFPTSILTDICQWRVCQSYSGRYEFQKRKFIKLLIKLGARTGPYYDTVIQCLVPASNISQADLRTYFREGYNINNLCKYYTKSKDKYCVNYIRWFLRHGLDTNAQFIQTCIEKALKAQNYEIVTLLLHAGVERLAITRWIKIKIFPCLPKQLRECNELAYNIFQEEDLVDFSDESLHIYPEVKELSEDEIDRQYESMVSFLSHPLTLKGLCRQCLHQSLGEPSPTMVKTLPIPSVLKRYILCHDL